MKKINTFNGDMNKANNGIIKQILNLFETRVKNAGDDPKKQHAIWSPFTLGSLLTWATGKNQKRVMASIDCIVESIACYNDMAESNNSAWLYVKPSENVKDFESVKCYFTTDRSKFEDSQIKTSKASKVKLLSIESFLKELSKLLNKYEGVDLVNTAAIKNAVDTVITNTTTAPTTAPTNKK